MKKVVNGVLCNTETAMKVGERSYSSPGDFSYFYEELYKTKSGRFFIYGAGGAASKYAKMVAQNEWGWGETIKLLSPESARRWAEAHLTGDEYIAAFGVPEEMSSVLIAEETMSKLGELKRKTGKDIDRLIAEAIDRYEP